MGRHRFDVVAALLFLLGISTVPSQAQVQVSITSVSFNDDTGSFEEGASSHVFNFDVTIALAAGSDNANEDGNMDRWSLRLAVVNSDGIDCANNTANLTSAQSGVRVVAGGEATISGVEASLNLRMCLCSSVTEVNVMLFSNTYTLNPAPPPFTTTSITCRGLIGETITIISAGSELVENEDTQTVTFDVHGSSESQGRSIGNRSSTNLWAAEVYIATGDIDDNSPVAGTLTAANVTVAEQRKNWPSGQRLVLMGLTATLNLTGVSSCNSIDLLCVSLSRNPAASVDFTINGGNITSCSPVICIGVLVNQVIPSFTSPTTIKQGQSNPNLQLTVTIRADDTKASITGTDLWQATAFGNADADCMNPTQVPATVDLQEGTDYGLDVNFQSVWSLIVVTLDMFQHSCSDAEYICIQVQRGANPTPDFTLSFSPDSAQYGAISVPCEGLTVESGTLTVNLATHLAAFKEDHQMRFDVTFISSADSGGAGGMDLWNVIVFPAQNNDNTGNTGAETSVPLQSFQSDAAFPGSGGSLSFMDLTATISLVNDACGTYRFLCARLERNAMSNPVFDINMPTPTVCSAMLNCENVKFTNTTVLPSGGASPNGLPLFEGVSDQDIYFDVILESDSTAGSVPSGTDHWQFTVSPGDVLADLTQPQKDAMLTAGEILTFTRIKATLNLTTERCNTLTSVCAEVMASDADSLGFMIDSPPVMNMGCFDITCQGVEINSLVINDGVTNFDLKEGTQGHMMTFSVGVMSNADAGSVRGTGLWELAVYLSMDNTQSASVPEGAVSADADAGNWQNDNVVAGELTTFSDVQVSLDLNAKCSDMRFLCVILRRADGQTFLLDPALNTLHACKAVPQCNGVEVASTSVDIRSGGPLVEGVPDNSPVIGVSLAFADSSASVTGMDSWSVTIYGSTNAEGTGDRIAEQTSITSGNPVAGTTVDLDGITWNVDMTDLLCVDVTFLCVEVESVDGKPFSLVPNTNHICSPADCEGVVITSEDFTFVAAMIFEATSPQFLTTSSIVAQAEGNGASIPDDETNIWEVSLFLNSADDGSGTTFASAMGLLLPTDQRQGINSTHPLTFDTNIQFQFTLDVMCGDALYVCLEISERDDAAKNYDITFPDTPTCKEIDCIGVVFTSANLSVPADTVLIENEEAHPVEVTFSAETAAMTATLQRVSNFWRVSVFANTQADGSGAERYGEAMATLTTGQRQMSLSASDTIEFADITAALNLGGFVCPSPMIYLCAELQRDPSSNPPFTIQGMPSPLIACERVECQGVLINSIDIDGLPEAVVENENNPLTLTVTAGVGGADASGTNLWRMNASLVHNGMVLAEHDVDLGDQAHADVVAGQPVTFSDLPVPFDLGGIVCPSSGMVMLCIELSRGGSADVNFTVTGVTRQCEDVPCLGVVIVQSAVSASTGSLRESRASNPITLDLTYSSSPTGARISGNDLWSIVVYGNNQEDGLGTRMAETTGTLQGNDDSFPLPKGGTVEFNGVTADLDLSLYLVCEEVHWVCAELRRGASPSPDFSLSDTNDAHIACTSLECTGVQITSTMLTIDDNVLTEDSGDQAVTVNSIRVEGGPESSMLPDNSDNFKVVIFGNSMDDTSGPRVAETEVILDASSQAINPGSATVLMGTASLNLTDVFCTDLEYLCVRVYRGDTPPVNFKLEGVPNENSLIDCVPVTCRGVRVTDGSLTTSSVLREGNPVYPVTVRVTFDTDAAGASVRAGTSDLFRLMAFLASTADGGDPSTDDQAVTLPQGSESQPVEAGNQIVFVDAVAMLDTTTWTCQDTNFICVRLSRDPQASANYLIEGWNGTAVDPTRLQTCMAIDCRGVTITNVVFRTDGMPAFKERDGDTSFTLDIGLVADPDGGGVVGSGLWNLTFALNSAPDGTGNTFGTETVAALSDENANRTVDPAGPTAFLTDVSVTLPAVTDIQCSQADPFYLCVKVEKAEGSDPDFTLMAVDWNCTEVTCYPVRISDISFTITTPNFIRENDENYLRINLEVTTDPMSADISGTGLWASPSFEVRDSADVTTLNSTGLYWTAPLQNMALTAGDTAEFENIFPVTLTPDGVTCDQLDRLCMTFDKGATPSPEFGLEFLTSNEVCVGIECRGVEIISTLITTITEGATVTERDMDGQDVILSITSASAVDAAGISGTDLWAVTLYYTPNSNGDVDATLGSADATLTSAQANTALIAGQDLVLENVALAAVDVSNLVCPDEGLWLCARLGRHASPDPLFTLSARGGDDSAFISCSNVTCRGVEIEATNLIINTGKLIPVERTLSHDINFYFQSTASGETATLMGTGLWRLVVFANRRGDGSHHRRSYEAEVALTTGQRNFPVEVFGEIIFSNLMVNLDLQATDTECRETRYFCGQLLKGDSPSPDFSLHGVPDDSRLITCESLDCNGVEINTFTLTNTGSDVLHENEDDQMFSFDAQLTSRASKGSVIGNDLWTFRAFVNNAADCLGDAEEVALTDATVLPGQEDQDLPAGGTIDFNVDVALDFQMKCPSWDRVYLCLEVFQGDTSSVAFTLFGNILQGVEIKCRGVEVTNTEISAVNLGSVIVESDDDATFDLNLRISSDSDGSSISGTGLWSMDVFMSDTESCEEETSTRITSILSLTNQNRPLSAGMLLFMNNVQATIPLPDALCENINFVCAELGKGPNPSPDFTLSPQPNETSLLASHAIECRGLHIVSTSLTLTDGEPLISNEPRHPISFTYVFETDPDGASVSNPRNLFRLQVAGTDSPTRAGVIDSENQVIVPYSPPAGFNIAAGQQYTLPVEAELNLRGARCDEIPYICVTLLKGANAEPQFTLTPDTDDPVLTTCSERLDCIGVRIVEESLSIISGIPFIEHATSNPVNLTVTLRSDAAGASAIGDNLWSAEVKLSLDDPLDPDTEFLAVTTGNFVDGDASEDLENGDTVQLRLEADLNLDGLSCPDVRYLVVNITNPNADPEFTLDWRNGLEYVIVSQSFTCFGVSLQPDDLTVTDGYPLRELAPDSDVTFSVSVAVTGDSATVMGQNLWAVRAFLSPDPNGVGTPDNEKTDADLDSTQGAMPIMAGEVSTLNDVNVTLDTSGEYCSDMAYLCVEVWRGDAAQPYYSIESPASQADLRICQMTQCNGVQIMSVAPTITSVAPLIEMRPNQVVQVDLNVTALPDSAGIVGDNLWAASVFVNPLEDGSGTRRSVRDAIIDPSQSGKDLEPGSLITLEDLVATMDFTGIPCSQMRYLCVTLQESDQAQPDFNLEDGDALTSCVETNCISVAIESGTLTLVSNEVLEGDDLADFTLDVSFSPWANSRSMQEDNSWRLHAYTTNRGDGMGGILALNEVLLTDAQQDQAVTVGTPLEFDDRDVTLDLSSLNCDVTTHLCVVLSTQSSVSFVLGGYPTEASLTACSELLCFPEEVDLYSVEVTERRIGVEFTEAFGDFDLYVLTYSPPDGITTTPFSIPRNLPRSLDFDQLVPGQLYTIGLTLRDGPDVKAGPFTLEERTRPDPVTLQLNSVTASELTVSWDAATGVFDHYTILLEPPDNGLPRTPLNVFPVENREITFTGLLGARQYNVTIYTVSGNAQSLPSTVIANTEPSTPQLTTTGNDETTVDLEWFFERDYIVDQYEIRHDPDDGLPQPIILPPEANRVTLENLTPGRMYDISLVAVSNINGIVEIRSSPAVVSVQMLPAPPAEITYEDPTETSIRILWPSAEGELNNYRVLFTPSVELRETIVPKNSPRELLYQGLDVASEYTVTITTHVTAINGELVSAPVQLTVYTLPYPPGPVTIVQVTTTSIEFQWQDADGPRNGYEVTFDPNEPEFVPQSPYFTTGNTMLLTGIKPHVTVDFEVRTSIGEVVSQPRDLRQRTFPTLPGLVRDFQIISFDTDNIQISFKVPEDPNGLILAYLVSVEGTKPGEPSESAFQTITALPNDVQFEEVISPLKAGYTYTLSIQATNTEGSGEPVVLNPVTLPIRAPFYTGLPLNNDDFQFVLLVTSSTITIRIQRSLFSDRNGVITSYTILVVENGANQTAVDFLPSYQQIRNLPLKPVYQTSEPLDLFNQAGARRRRQSAESADFVVGEETNCPSTGYCNGPLDPISQYRIAVRAFTENGDYTDTPWSDVIATRFDPLWFIYALIPVIGIALLVAFIMCLCACIAGDDKKKKRKQPPRREKPPVVVQSPPPNENASNNVNVASTSSQEQLVPAEPATPPPKRSPTSRPIAVVKFGQHVRKMSTRTGDNFAKEFEDLNLIGETEAKTVGALPKNVDKNRYGNIFPFDYNRVRLDKDEDYINASLMSGFSGANEYIAAQGPQANSVNDFWQMVWEQKVPVIAVVGSPVEKGRVKFAQYWPSDSTPITFGNVTVNRVSEREETEQGYVIRELCLESGSEVRSLRQFQFTAWPVHGVPKKSDQMLNFIRTVRLHLPENAGPLVVHCGAGIGRTGVFITLDMLTQQLALDEEYLDVFGTVAAKREERTNMVQTELQYEFVHRALLDILEGRVTGPNWMLKSKSRISIDSDQQVDNDIAEAAM